MAFLKTRAIDRSLDRGVDGCAVLAGTCINTTSIANDDDDDGKGMHKGVWVEAPLLTSSC